MNKLVIVLGIVITGLTAGTVGGQLVYRYAEAQAIASAPLDAGPAPAAAVTSDLISPAGAGDAAAAPEASGRTVTPPGPPASSTVPADATDPTSFNDRIVALWRRGAFTPALILAAFAGLLALRRWVPRFRTGAFAAYSAIAVTALATLVEPAARGATPTLEMMLSAVTAAVLLVMRPQASAPASGSTAATASGVLPLRPGGS